jgi:hypothetical protein
VSQRKYSDSLSLKESFNAGCLI